jgi:hypothetical protein
MKFARRMPLFACVLVLASCAAEEVPPRTAIHGRWLNADTQADRIEFRDEGSLLIAGDRKGQRIWGTYSFLNDVNIEMRLRFAEDNPWRPAWMPPGVRKNPVVRARLYFAGDRLNMRPRGQIKADHFDQYIEFGTLRFDRMPEETDTNVAVIR